jgi:ABC-type sugar transport system substrate-binding protein
MDMRSTFAALAFAAGAAAVLAFGSSAGAADDEKAKWAEHTGDLPFVIGYEKGMKEVEFTGRPPMYFFTATW